MPDEVRIRRSRREDAPVIHAIRSHPEVRRHQPLVPDDPDQVAERLETRGTAPLAPDQDSKVMWTIEAAGEVVGWISVDVTSREHHIGNLGYSLHPRVHRRGIMGRALALALPAIFNPSGLHIERLEAVAAVDNIASRRVLERGGFTFEGIARGYLILSDRRIDHTRYARLSTD